MPTITTYLTFKDRAEEAVEFYVSTFEDSRILNTTRVGGGTAGVKGTLVSATFQLEGQTFMAMNGGSSFTFSQGISLFVSCESQNEIDRLWERMTEGGSEGPCGWLTDRFGVSWQIVPSELAEMLADKDPKKAKAVLDVMLTMKKLDIARLKAAWRGADAVGARNRAEAR